MTIRSKNMLKVKLAEGYPPEEGRYVRGNDYSPVAVCVILDTFDFAIPPELNELVMLGTDSGAAISGMLQTENVGLEKIVRIAMAIVFIGVGIYYVVRWLG